VSSNNNNKWSLECIFHERRGNATLMNREHSVPLSCHYWGFNDPFCCIHCSRNSQCFSVGH